MRGIGPSREGSASKAYPLARRKRMKEPALESLPVLYGIYRPFALKLTTPAIRVGGGGAYAGLPTGEASTEPRDHRRVVGRDAVVDWLVIPAWCVGVRISTAGKMKRSSLRGNITDALVKLWSMRSFCPASLRVQRCGS